MEFTDRAILLQIDPFKEHDALITAFTRDHGLVRGIGKWAFSKRNRGIYCMGNWVQLTWNARLEEHLGNVNCEMDVPAGALLMRDRRRCYALQSMASLILSTFEQRDPHPMMYHAIDQFVEAMQFGLPGWLADYARFEAVLLREAGFGLGLDACIATGKTENLSYLSPKSGCAVSEQAGREYHHKLFPYPSILTQELHQQASPEAIEQALEITGYFLYKWLFTSLGKSLPTARERFLCSVVAALPEPA